MRLNTRQLRPLWLKTHRWLALTIGFFLAVLGLTGSLSLYGDGLDRLLNPRLSVEPAGQRLPLDSLLAEVRHAHPDDRGSWTLELPRKPDEPLVAWLEQPAESRGQLYAPRMVAIDPYSGWILASRLWGETARTWLLDLHTQLHFGRWGWRFVGLLGPALILSALSGLLLWWPGVTGLREALRVRHQLGMRRWLSDLHRLAGLIALVPLLILAVTGFLLAYPAVGESLTGASGMRHGDDGPGIRSTGRSANPRPVNVDEAVLLARGPFPSAEVRRVSTPDGPEGTYRVTLRQRIDPNERHPMTAVWVDQYSGHIREVRNAARFTAGERTLAALWPLHTGESLGGWGRLVWFLTGLFLPLLYVSGLARWLIGRGSLPDRPVDLSRVRGTLLTTGTGTLLLARRAYRRAHPLASRALRFAAARFEPELRRLLGVAREWLRRRLG
jgi:uncharacterized iron-regulated membrane protein